MQGIIKIYNTICQAACRSEYRNVAIISADSLRPVLQSDGDAMDDNINAVYVNVSKIYEPWQ